MAGVLRAACALPGGFGAANADAPMVKPANAKANALAELHVPVLVTGAIADMSRATTRRQIRMLIQGAGGAIAPASNLPALNVRRCICRAEHPAPVPTLPADSSRHRQ